METFLNEGSLAYFIKSMPLEIPLKLSDRKSIINITNLEQPIATD
jgi:hypothetical protein